MRKGLLLAATAPFAFLPASHLRAQSFDGPYAGVQVGGHHTDIRNLGVGPAAAPLDDERSSFTGGLFAGYDRQVARRVVLGAEAGVDLAADDDLETSSATGRLILDPKWSLDLTARTGYLLSPTTLAYVRGGYSNVRLGASGDIATSESEYRDSWTLGAGIERKILKRISARLEYRYSDLGEDEGTFDRHRLLAGIAYHF